MSYYLLILIFAAIFSFYLAIRNERKFQKKLNELECFRGEIRDLSVRLKQLNSRRRNTKEVNKIIFHFPYQLMDYDLIRSNDEFKTKFCFKDELDLINSSFRYGKEGHKLNRNIEKTRLNNKLSSYSIPSKNHSFA